MSGDFKLTTAINLRSLRLQILQINEAEVLLMTGGKKNTLTGRMEAKRLERKRGGGEDGPPFTAGLLEFGPVIPVAGGRTNGTVCVSRLLHSRTSRIVHPMGDGIRRD
jgi:hypothetical protein